MSLFLKSFSSILKASFKSVIVMKRLSPNSTVLKDKFGYVETACWERLVIAVCMCSSRKSACDPQVPIGDSPPLCVGGTHEYHP